MDSTLLAKTKRTTWQLSVAALALVTGIALAVCVPSAWDILVLPGLALLTTALLWLGFVRLCFCRNALLMAKSFRRTLRTTLFVPVWLMLSWVFLALPQYDIQSLNETLMETLLLILVAALMTIVPLTLLVTGVAAIVCAVGHLRGAPSTAPAIYRGGPFVLALLLFLMEAAVCAWLFYTYFL